MKYPLLTCLFIFGLLFPASLLAWNTPAVVSPASGSSGWTEQLFDWGSVTGSEAYQIEIDTVPTFTSMWQQLVTKIYINSNSANGDTQHSFSNLFFGKTYYWRVRAYVTNDTSAWSVTRTFNTNDYVILNSPANASSQWTGITLDWLAHPGVTYYDVRCDTTLSFNSAALHSATSTYINNNNGNADTQYGLSNLFFGKTYYWQVRAINTVDTSAWSAPWNFTTNDYVSLNSPANGATAIPTTGVALDWLAHTGVGSYQFQMDSVNLYNSPALLQADKTYINSNSGNSDTQESTGTLQTNRVYFWRVRALNAVDTSAWTERWFTTGTSQPVIPSAPVLISPANAAILQSLSPTLTWNTTANATSYEYQLATTANFTSVVASGTSTSLSASISGLAQNTLYYWRVRAFNGNMASPWSTVWQFTTAGSVTTLPVHVSPSDLSTNIPLTGVVLDWNPVANATSYDYEYSTAANFSTNVTGGNVGLTQTTMGTLQPSTTYYWHVRAINPADSTAWTTAWSFTTLQQLNAPSLVSPANNVTAQALTGLVLDWDVVPAATSYEYQYATDVNFTTIINSGNVSSTQVTTGTLNPMTTYYWRVRATDGIDLSPWSVVWNFTTSSTAGLDISDESATGTHVFPMPCTTHFTVQSANAIGTITLSDLNGCSVLKVSGPPTTSLQVDVSHLPAGLYILTLDGKQPAIHKVVVGP